MASEKKPKGILKSSSSFDKDGHHEDSGNKQAKWDEMNILATYHPPGKDYGHMKIDEPPTPYNTIEGEDMDESGEEKSQLDHLQNVAERLEGSHVPKVLEDEDSSDEEVELTEEMQEKKQMFEQKRKLHYNEFQAVKLARQLLDDGDDDEHDDGDDDAHDEGDDDEHDEEDDEESRKPENVTKT